MVCFPDLVDVLHFTHFPLTVKTPVYEGHGAATVEASIAVKERLEVTEPTSGRFPVRSSLEEPVFGNVPVKK
jgi:hypothetical protein